MLGALHAAALDCGPATRDAASVRRWLADPEMFAYLAEDGFLGYRWHGDTSKAILIEVLQAGSAQTAHALWRIVASHSSVTEVVYAMVGPADPVSWLTREPDVGMCRLRHWMLRVIDPAAAVSGRGFPAAVHTEVALELTDANLPGNAGQLYARRVRRSGISHQGRNRTLGQLAHDIAGRARATRLRRAVRGPADGDASRRRARGGRGPRHRRRA